MEQKELEYFCDWLIENNITIVAGYRSTPDRWRKSETGSKIYTTEELVKKYLNEEKL